MDTKYDVAIIGTGPAGLSAALNCHARNKKFIVIGPKEGSKKVSLARKIDNYLGLDKISGKDLNDRFLETIKTYDFNHLDVKVNSVYSLPNGFFLELSDGSMLETISVIVATGVVPSKKLKGEEEFLGNGVSYCATCDANLYKGKKVVLVGEHEEAIEEANFLVSVASKVYYIGDISNFDKLDSSIEKVNDKVIAIEGDTKAKKVLLENREIEADGFFIIKDAQSPSDLIPGIELEKNHIKVDDKFESNLKGLFACGDIVGQPYQIAKACGQGNIAGINASKFVENNKIK